jgi:phosphatidylserine/phosphatidylglycerophosphate/cardiolipin synthase-like enzyme
MKKIPAIIILVLSITITISAFAFNVDVANVCFSPNGGCTSAIVDQIDNAKSEILIQAYSFTSAPIAKALVNAYKKESM